MITFVYGTSGSGKSDYILNQLKLDAENGIQAYLIVPEQQTVLREAETSKILPSSAQLTLEVLNFTRLANRVFRKFGGLSSNYITKGSKALVMWRALVSSIPHLTEYADAAARDRGCVNMMLSAVSEFKAYRISPAMLERAADELTLDSAGDSETRLSSRLKDISLIYSAYEQSLLASYSDPSDDLDALSDKLSRNNFFKGCNVYLDSFYGYTPQEINVISKIFNQAENVTVTFCCPHPKSDRADDPHFEFVKDTAAKIHRTAVLEGHVPEVKILDTNIRHKSEDLKILEKNLWNFHSKAEKTEPEHINIIRAADNYDAAEAASLDIVRAVRNGIRYRDIAVIVRNVDTYRGIIDTALEKHGVPHYLSTRTDLTSKPAIKLIMNALAISSSSWRRDDVIGYIKTGLSGISYEESDLFEKYCDTWSISGSRFTDDEDWFMNPEGYSEKITDRNKKILASVNTARKKIVSPLKKLFSAFRRESSISDVCRSLFEFLTEINLCDQLKSDSDRMSARGDKSGASECLQLWNIICDVLDMLVDTLPDAMIKNTDQFAQLLKYVFDATDIGTIPTGTDEVTIGDASMLRLSEAKHVVVLGANEGEFPQSVRDDGIFSDTDKIRLEGLGIVLSSDSRMKNAEELFWFYRSVCCASDGVTIICSDSETGGSTKKAPSIAVNRILHLFPKLKIKLFGDSEISDRLLSPDASYEYLPATDGTKLGKSLRSALYSAENHAASNEKGRLSVILSACEVPLTQEKVSLSPETAGKLFGHNISMTQSRLENFVMCRFKYYCRYVLKLGEGVRSGFNAVDVGNFVHKILERFMTRIIGNDGSVRTDMDEDEIEELVDAVIKEYIEEACYGELDKSNRLTHLFIRLRRNVLVFVRSLIAEFSQSDFIPSFFELKITGSDPESPPPVAFSLPDGTDISIYGVADRVDTYQKNGSVYIRVVDYKTGTKDFSIEDIKLGLNLQLLLYLFAIWKCPDGLFKERLMIQNYAYDESIQLKMDQDNENEIVPAGILYFSAKSPEITIDVPPEDEKELDEAINKKMVRKGVLLNDTEILTAMEKRLEGNYIPIKLNKSGAIGKSKSLASLEEFGKYYSEVSDTIKRIGTELKKGQADAVPLQMKNISPCTHCQMKPVCRVNLR